MQKVPWYGSQSERKQGKRAGTALVIRILRGKRLLLLPLPLCDEGNNDRPDKGDQGKAPLTPAEAVAKNRPSLTHYFPHATCPPRSLCQITSSGSRRDKVPLMINFLLQTPTLLWHASLRPYLNSLYPVDLWRPCSACLSNPLRHVERPLFQKSHHGSPAPMKDQSMGDLELVNVKSKENKTPTQMGRCCRLKGAHTNCLARSGNLGKWP